MTINTYDKAIELMDKKGNIYSSRPTLPIQELAGLQDTISLLPYGPKIRESRAWLHGEFGRKTVSGYAQAQESTARRFVGSLVKNPEGFFNKIDWYVGHTAQACCSQY